MARLANFLMLIVVLGILAVGCGNESGTLTSQDSEVPSQALSAAIPPGATIESATFYIYVEQASNQTISIHRITAPWEEMIVTWENFGGAYVPGVSGSFVADGVGWRSANITGLVQDWYMGVYENYGFLLSQDESNSPLTAYHSRNNSVNQPYVELCYSSGGGTTCETVEIVADAWIYEIVPDANTGSYNNLLTGWRVPTSLEKQSLLRFELEPMEEEGCTRTIGYWKNHAGFGQGQQSDMVTPLLPIRLGDAGGSKSILVADAATAVDVLEMKTYGKPSNGITKLYAQLLGAKLNVASGASGSDVADAIADADAFLAGTDWNDWKGLSDADKEMVLDWKDMLDDYNNGVIGPGHCD